MHVAEDSDEIDLPTGNPFMASGSMLANMKEFFNQKLVPGIKSAGASIASAAKERDFSAVKSFGAKVVYFTRRVTFVALTILADVSSGSADFFASLAKKVNPGEHVPQLADRFSSRPPQPNAPASAPPERLPSEASDVPDTIVDP